MSKPVNKTLIIIVVVIFVAAVTGVVTLFMPGTVSELLVRYPFDGTMFPPEIAPPTIMWDDTASGAAMWKLTFVFQDNDAPLEAEADKTGWTPPRDMWESIKKRSLGKTATVTITGHKPLLGIDREVSRKSFSMTTSKDEVGAPIFFRAVTLPFEYAVNHMETISWCLGDISSEDPAKVVLDNMPVCGNCHSFTADGGTIGMDVDYANDKGSYIIANVAEDTPLTNDDVITWSEYKRDDGELTFGLLSQISPDGRYAVSTVKDRSVFVPVDDKYYSQLFFPLKGILVYYDRAKQSFAELPGASDRQYVQSNPAWSPDVREIVFAKSEVGSIDDDTGQVLLTQAQCEKYISRSELFKFDLYRLPFNKGRGGEAMPIEGASNNNLSNYFPKYSPDGKWIVFCRAESFMLLQPDSRLYIMPAEGGEPREMTCNTDNMNSWHSWSPNGKWMVFTSKAFGPYTQLMLTHIDENGNDTPPVLLSNLIPTERAANIPEFVNMPSGVTMKMHELFIDYYSFFNKAGQLVDEGRFEEAEQFFRKSIGLKPDFPLSHKRLGYLLAGMNRIGEAEKEWHTALKLDPKDHLLHLNFGSLYLDRNEIVKARESFETAIKLEKKCAPAYTGLGVILIKEGDIDGAQKRFEASIAADPGYGEGHYRLATIYKEKKLYDKAEESFRKAIRFNPRNGYAVLGLARLLVIKDAFTEALEMYNKAISLMPANVISYVELGNLFIKIGDRNQAIKAFERALELDPGDQNLRNSLAALKRKR